MALTKVTGSVIKDSVSLSGNVSVGGTLTYQDVTNVDALGIGTFRTGIKVLAGQVDVGNNIKLGNAGVITATSFVGSGANLTSLPAQATIANNGDNRVITGGSGVNLNAESKLTFDGTGLLHLNNSTGSSDAVLKLESESGSDAKLTLDTSNGGGAGAHIEFLIDGTLKGGISYVSNASASDTHDIIFKNNSNTERLRIDSSGRLLKSGQAALTSTSLSHPIQVAADSSAQNIVLFGRASDDISAIDFYEADKSTRLGEIQYRTNELNIRHRSAGADIIFATTPSGGSLGERLRIDSSGRMGLGTNAPDGYDNEAENFVVASADHTGITIASTGSNKRNNLYFADGTSGNAAYRGAITYDHNIDDLYVRTAGAERMRILGDGRVLINTSDGAAFSSRKLSVADVSSGGTTAIEIRSATNGSGRLYFTDSTSSGDAGSYAGKVFYDHNTDYMAFYTGGGTNTPGERMKIDAYGRVTTPNQPSFNAYINGFTSESANTGMQVMPFNTTNTNIGGHFKTSGSDQYKFVAPVAGNYYFSLSQNHSARVDTRIVKNGVDYHGGESETTSQNWWDHHHLSCVIPLAVGDKVHCTTNNQDGGSKRAWNSGYWESFAGFLIG